MTLTTRQQIVKKLRKYCDAPDEWYEQWSEEDLAQMLDDIIKHSNSN
jgi:hypothetical protein